MNALDRTALRRLHALCGDLEREVRAVSDKALEANAPDAVVEPLTIAYGMICEAEQFLDAAMNAKNEKEKRYGL